ncbi:MAG: hypothetical protein ACTSRG_13245 [Candidatus Helarchaeota archaeon]
MQCQNACCVSFFDKLQITEKEKDLLEEEAKKRNKKIEITKEKILISENPELFTDIYFLKINPCPFYKNLCTINQIKPLMCKIYPLRNIKQISKKEYYFVIDYKCNWIKNNGEIFEHPYRNLFKIFKNEVEIYFSFYIDLLNKSIF